MNCEGGEDRVFFIRTVDNKKLTRDQLDKLFQMVADAEAAGPPPQQKDPQDLTHDEAIFEVVRLRRLMRQGQQIVLGDAGLKLPGVFAPATDDNPGPKSLDHEEAIAEVTRLRADYERMKPLVGEILNPSGQQTKPGLHKTSP